MRLFSASLRKSLADVTRRKGRTLLVVLGIFIGVAGLTAINFTDDTLVSAFAFTQGYQATQPDFQLTVDRLDPALLPALQSVANVKAVQYVSSFGACWQARGSQCIVGMNIFSYPDLQRTPITPFQLTAGRYPGVGEIVMEQGDQSLHDVAIGDTVTFYGNARHMVPLRVVGLARTPYVNSGASGTALAYMSDAGLQQLDAALGHPMYTLPTGQRIDAYQHHIQVKFHSTNPQLERAAVTALQRVLRVHSVQVLDSGFAPKVDASTLGTIEGVFALLRTLALVAVLLSTLLILNTITTLVAEQTAIIGTMKALGGSRATIIRGYLVSVGIYSLLATLPALALGLYAGNQLAAALAPQIPLTLGPFAVAPWVVALSLIVGLVAALVPLWNGTRITVHEALSAYGVGVGQRRSRMTWLGRQLTWVSQTTWLGLRGLFRRRWRAALSLTTLGLTAAAATTTEQIIVGARDRSLSAVDQLAGRVSAIVNPTGASSDDPGYFSGNGGTIDTFHENATRRQGDAYILYYLLYALALVVGVVGVLGLANALVASVLERRREIGLLRAVGAGGRRVAQVFWVESLALGALSWCVGALIGLPLAYAFVQTFAWQIMPVDFYLDPLAFVIMLAAVLAIASIASIVPAWRASRLRVAEVLRYE